MTKSKKITVRVKRVPRKNASKQKKEITRLGRVLRNIGGLAGGMAGNFVGQSNAGSAMGTNLGAALSRWLGSGDYTVKSNSIISSLRTSDAIPAMHNNGQSITVRHKEYLGAVTGKTAFTVQNTFNLNPGLPETFPWLSDIATRFQEYVIKGAVFHYVPTSGTAVTGTNPALGSIMLQTSYRANDNAPASKVEMLNEFWSSEGKPSEPLAHPIECAPQETVLQARYVRNTSIPTTESALFYDLGVTYLAVQGQLSDDTVLGDLWLTYEVELRKPVMRSSVADNSQSTYITFTTKPDTGPAYPYGQHGYDYNTTSHTLTFPEGAAGVYLVEYHFVGTVEAAVNLSATWTSPVNMTWSVISAPGSSTSAMSGFCSFRAIIPDPTKQAAVTAPTASWTENSTATHIHLTVTRVSSVL